MAKNYLAISDSTAPSESAFTVAKLKTYQIKDAWPSRLRYFSIRTPSFYRLTACKVNYPLQVYAETWLLLSVLLISCDHRIRTP